MKIRDIINGEKPTLSFEVFPPKKDTDFANVEACLLYTSPSPRDGLLS